MLENFFWFKPCFVKVARQNLTLIVVSFNTINIVLMLNISQIEKENNLLSLSLDSQTIISRNFSRTDLKKNQGAHQY